MLYEVQGSQRKITFSFLCGSCTQLQVKHFHRILYIQFENKTNLYVSVYKTFFGLNELFVSMHFRVDISSLSGKIKETSQVGKSGLEVYFLYPV